MAWKGEALQKQVVRRATRGLERAGRILRDHIKRQSSEPLPPQEEWPWYTDARGRHHQEAPSQESYPFKRTGDFRKSVAMEMAVTDDGHPCARVGSSIKYAKWLELGTRYMAPRPWLTLGLQEAWPEMQGAMILTGSDLQADVSTEEG